MLATLHLHVLHHTLDPFGIVLAGLAIAGVLVLAGLLGARLVRKPTDTTPPESATSTESSTSDG